MSPPVSVDVSTSAQKGAMTRRLSPSGKLSGVYSATFSKNDMMPFVFIWDGENVREQMINLLDALFYKNKEGSTLAILPIYLKKKKICALSPNVGDIHLDWQINIGENQ